MKQSSRTNFSNICQISIEDTRELADKVMTYMFKGGMCRQKATMCKRRCECFRDPPYIKPILKSCNIMRFL